MRLYCTKAKRLVDLEAKPDLRFYVCGITPYDSMHIGHVALFLTYDVLARRMGHLGSSVLVVRNITDVDDPLLPRALQLKIPYWDLVESEIDQYERDVRALGLLPTSADPRASQHIDDMVDAIEYLLKEGHAYRLGDLIYYAVESDPEFGSLSGFDESTMIEHSREHGGDPDAPGKRHPLDFVLWQPSRSSDGEPEYTTRIGVGRPGWHIGCSVMSRKHLGAIDLHGGGEDLIFPHHECEDAQNRSLADGSRVGMWMHCAFVSYQGAKMSKSLGNIVLARDVIKEYDARVLRLAILTHYRHREGLEWLDEFLPEAATTLDRWLRAAALESQGYHGDAADQASVEVEREFFARLDDNLDVPSAVAVLDRYARALVDSVGTATSGTSGTSGTSDAGASAGMLTCLAEVLGVNLDRATNS